MSGRTTATAATGEQHGPPVSRRPDEVAADRPAQLELVADLEHVGEVRGDLAIGHPLDGQPTRRHPPPTRASSCACAVAVLRGQPHVDVLAGEVTRPVRDVEDQGRTRRVSSTSPTTEATSQGSRLVSLFAPWVAVSW